MNMVSITARIHLLAVLWLVGGSTSCSKSSDQEAAEKRILIGEWRPASPYQKNKIIFFEESNKLFMRYKSEQISLTFKDGAFVQDHALGGRIQHKGDSLYVSGSETYYVKDK